MRKLTIGENIFSIALSYDIGNLASPAVDFYYSYGELCCSIISNILSYDCFTGVAVISLTLTNVEDGEYNVVFRDKQVEIYKGIFNVLSYKYIDFAAGVVIGEAVSVGIKEATITTETSDWLTTEHSLVLIT